ncbi:MAG: transcriptional regulator [Acidimicrobiia bacterium]|nr:transcriptional regulator [Acidimicrobiia bacterium]
MAALDLLGRRWSLRVLWELRDGPHGFRALRDRCDGMSMSVLRQRLVELGAAQLVEQDDAQRYRLTALGEELRAAIEPLTRWSERWSAEVGAAEA